MIMTNSNNWNGRNDSQNPNFPLLTPRGTQIRVQPLLQSGSFHKKQQRNKATPSIIHIASSNAAAISFQDIHTHKNNNQNQTTKQPTKQHLLISPTSRSDNHVGQAVRSFHHWTGHCHSRHYHYHRHRHYTGLRLASHSQPHPQ